MLTRNRHVRSVVAVGRHSQAQAEARRPHSRVVMWRSTPALRVTLCTLVTLRCGDAARLDHPRRGLAGWPGYPSVRHDWPRVTPLCGIAAARRLKGCHSFCTKHRGPIPLGPTLGDVSTSEERGNRWSGTS
jgi:hypothetical protein